MSKQKRTRAEFSEQESPKVILISEESKEAKMLAALFNMNDALSSIQNTIRSQLMEQENGHWYFKDDPDKIWPGIREIEGICADALGRQKVIRLTHLSDKKELEGLKNPLSQG